MKKIAILGASYLQLPIVKKAKENGIEVHCFAWDDDKAVCKKEVDFFYNISVLEKEMILEKCREINIDGITTIATDICIPTISFVANHLNLKGNSLQCAELTTNKSKMRASFNQNNILSPKFITVSGFNESDFKDFRFPVIVKPIDRSGSLGVVKVNHIDELASSIIKSIKFSFSKQCIVEEFVFGREISVETVSWNGAHMIIAFTDKIVTKAPFFVELEHHQPADLQPKLQGHIEDVVINVLQSTQVENGISHVELLIDQNKNIYVVEIGSRMGGDFIGSDLVSLSTGIDFLQICLDISLDQLTFPIKPGKQSFSGVYFLSEETSYLLPYFDASSPPAFIVKKERFDHLLKAVESSNDRSGYMIYQADKKIILKK